MNTEMSDKKILSIPVPATLDAFIHERIAVQGFQTVSEYVRALIRADQQHAAREKLEAKLLEAVERGDYQEATPEWWQRLRDAALAPTSTPGKA